jgi:hypothetical protein
VTVAKKRTPHPIQEITRILEKLAGLAEKVQSTDQLRAFEIGQHTRRIYALERKVDRLERRARSSRG